MAIYSLETKRETLHGTLDKHIPPVLTIQSGDTVVFRTLEGDWRWDKPPLPASSSGRTFVERRMPGDRGHALCGPIYVEGARPGMTLKVSVERVVPYTGAGAGSAMATRITWRAWAFPGKNTFCSGIWMSSAACAGATPGTSCRCDRSWAS